MKALIVFPDTSAMWAGGEDICRARMPDVDLIFARGLAEAAERIGEAEAAMGFVFNQQCADNASRLKWVQSMGAGTDALRPLLALPGVVLTGAQGLSGPAVSEAALALMLGVSRQTIDNVRAQDAGTWAPRPSALLDGKTVGIVGTGKIACATALKCKAFGMTVLGFSATPRLIDGYDDVLPRGSLQENAALLDYLVLVTALSEETRHLIDGDVLAAMKPSAYLVNVARGRLVDEPALIAALHAGRIAGAGLDVFETEPLPAGHPMWTTPNVLITAHSAGARLGYLEAVVDVFAANMAAWRAGQPEKMPTLIRPDDR